jgi:hypothetical protein
MDYGAFGREAARNREPYAARAGGDQNAQPF